MDVKCRMMNLKCKKNKPQQGISNSPEFQLGDYKA